MAASDRHVGQTIAGKYLVERSLGHGGMGEVYVAVQAPLGRRVALKLVRRDMADDDKAMARFEREAKALAQLTDPHIVTIHDFGVTDGGELFMAMELVDGESLRQRIRREGGALDMVSALRIARGICGALAAAHHAGVVHRDLKPENVMLTRVSSSNGNTSLPSFGADFVKVLDFGVARVSDASSGATPATLTETGKLVGTPGYMAPEMLLYGVLDEPRSDLYALGVILFEMLTGEAPFHAPTPVALVMKHAHEAPRRLSEVIDTAPPDVESLVLDLLRKEPAERPPNAMAVMERLAKILADPASLSSSKPISRHIDVNAKTVPKMATPHGPALPLAEPAMTAPQVAMLPPAVAQRAPSRVLLVAGAVIVAVGIGALGVLIGSRGADRRDDPRSAGAAPPANVPAQPKPATSAAEPAPAAPEPVKHVVEVKQTEVKTEVKKRVPARAAPRPRVEETPPPPPPPPPKHVPDLSEGHTPDLK